MELKKGGIEEIRKLSSEEGDECLYLTKAVTESGLVLPSTNLQSVSTQSLLEDNLPKIMESHRLYQ